uniref:ADAM metallopeptidase domain 18 n=1 Tax=Cercocebus atys TaxID=9531 RepID=A0A2K5M2A6_CERAT
MFFLLALLTELGRLQAHVGSEGIFLHVTVPLKILSNDSEVSERKMIYIITIDGQPYTLHLRKQSFLPQKFLVYTYNEAGSLHSESPYFMMHCHYQGYAAEFPNSFVTLSICSGLRGFLQFENVSYGIEPLESSARFEHIIYQLKNNDPNVSILAENYSHIWQKDQSYKVPLNSQKKNLSKLLPQYLEIYIIVEKALMFTQFKLTVILSSLELWSNENQISTSGDADDILQRFLAWKRDYLILRPHDIAYLLVYRKHPKYVGHGMFFHLFLSSLISLNSGILFYFRSARGIKIFSNCSMHDYRYSVSKFEAKCLQKVSNLQPLHQNQPVCGNGILESNEECDCGNKKECQFKKCCDYNTCKLKGSVKCGSGPCCTSKCELSIVGTPCRKSVDPECDFTEYCNGTSSDCVPDTYALNGHLCKLGTAYCYNGQCQTTDNQCAKIFGKGAQGAPFACFKEVNSLHERSENCGFKNSQPLPCEKKDVLCGKLACVQPHKNAYKSDIQYTVYSYIQDHVCVSIATGSSMRSDGTDNAYVADGTMCGPEMYCVNKTCRKVHLTGYNCNTTTKCKGKGICNNFGNCQCFPGHKPPDCKFQFGSPGGSIDDGNFQKSDEFYTEKGYNTHWNNWFILSFYIVLPFFIIFTIVIFKRNEIRKLCNRENTECNRNEEIV